jgi:hypothetical protein
MKLVRTISGILALTGLWEALTPFILGYPNTATALWNALLIGIMLFMLELSAVILDDIVSYRTLDWISALLGLWLVATLFIPGYTAPPIARWNDIAVGLMVTVLTIWATTGLDKPTTVQP